MYINTSLNNDKTDNLIKGVNRTMECNTCFYIHDENICLSSSCYDYVSEILTGNINLYTCTGWRNMRDVL